MPVFRCMDGDRRAGSVSTRDCIVVTGLAVLVLAAAGIFLVVPSLDLPASPGGDGPDGAGGPAAGMPVQDNAAAAEMLPLLSQEEAEALVREDYPGSLYSVTGISLTGEYPAGPVYVFGLAPREGLAGERNETVFIDATTGDYYNPAQENAGIAAGRAKELAREAFPAVPADRVKIRFSDGSQYVRGWEFFLMNGTGDLVHGGLDADTGDLSWYAMGIVRKDRPENPAISLTDAQRAADREILGRNGVLPLFLADARLDPLGMPGQPVAGTYVFVYKRVIHDIACDSDGILISVDSVSGNVVEYRKSWSLPEDAVAPSAAAAIPKDDAVDAVKREAAGIYPASAAGLRIVSAGLRWNDYHDPDKVMPAPGSIPLVWKVVFDDEILRSRQWPGFGTGRVDARTGDLLELYYRH